MTKVHTLFADLFTYVLLFEQTHLQGELQPSYEQVRQDIAALFQQEKATAKRQGMLDKDFQDAGFAVVAWADETILKHTTWKYHHEWNTSPLQLEYYQTRNAGEEFFERLERLGAAQQAVREIYYFCLALGFSGQYFLGLEDALKLTQIRHEQAQHFTRPIESVQDIGKITVQPYEVHPPVVRLVRYPFTHLLLQAGLVLLVIVPLVFFGLKTCDTPPVRLHLTVHKGGSGSGTVTSAPEGMSCGSGCTALYTSGTKVTLKATPDPGSVFSGWSGDSKCAEGVTLTAGLTCTATFNLDAQAIQQLLPQQQCARVSVGLHAGVIDLGGRVASASQGADIREIVGSVKGVTQVKEKFDVIPRPFCAVLELLEPVKKQAEERGIDLVINLDKEGELPDYYAGDRLLITVKTSAKFDSYVYVDYYDADGMVGHLLPSPDQKTNRLESNRPLAIRALNISANPPGRELITVIASKTELFSGLRDNEPAESYLNDLRQALSKTSVQPDVTATFHFMRTNPKISPIRPLP
jgi:type IV/VI secretion system ImpK/VasF family protein